MTLTSTGERPLPPGEGAEGRVRVRVVERTFSTNPHPRIAHSLPEGEGPLFTYFITNAFIDDAHRSSYKND